MMNKGINLQNESVAEKFKHCVASQFE